MKFTTQNLLPESNLPWIGTYFGIPESAKGCHPYPPRVIRTTEYEIHVLHKDLTDKKYKLRDNTAMYGASMDNILMALRYLAYRDYNAIAHKVYMFGINPDTGERKQVGDWAPAVKIGENTWKWFYPKDSTQERVFSTEFI